MLKRIMSLLLCVLMAASALAFVACDDADSNNNSGAGGTASDKFLNESKDWSENGNAMEITILAPMADARNYWTCQIESPEASDDPVVNAFYIRNTIIKENYGIDIKVAQPENGQSLADMFYSDMMSGDNEYQAVCASINTLANYSIEGKLVDLNNPGNDYLHLDQEWWDQTLIKDVKINNKVFYLAGDAIVTDDEATWAMYFNKDLVEEHSLENPYDLVRDGEWTLDKMYELAKQVELTQGSVKSYDPSVGDKWGLLVQSYDFYQFMLGAQQPMIDNTGDVPVLRVDAQENTATFEKIKEFFINDPVNVGVADNHREGFASNDYEGIYGQETQNFANGNGLFMPNSIAIVGQSILKNAEANYGILPMPKRSEDQEDYSCSVTVYSFGVIAVPITNEEKLSATCYALEAMAFYGKEYVTPEYYTRTLKHKEFEDTDSSEMLDLIFRNRCYDLANVIDFNGSGKAGQGTLYFYTNLLFESDPQIVSNFEKNKNNYQAGIDAIIEQCYN